MLHFSLKSRGLTRPDGLALASKNASQAKAAMKPSKWPGLFGPGLAWLTASGRALHSTKGTEAGLLLCLDAPGR